MLEAIRIPIVVNGDMSSTIVSTVVRLEQMWGYMIQAIYTTSGTLGGILSLEASVSYNLDPLGNVLNAGTWTTVLDSPKLITGAGDYIWDMTRTAAPYVRLRYAPAGGDTGTLNAFQCIKGV